MMTVLVPLISILSSAPPAAPGPARPVERSGTGAELLTRATDDLEKVHRALREVLARVQDARDEKDLVKLLCLDDKVARIKVLVAVAEKADVALAEAVSAGDDAAPIEGSKIAIARGKADGLRSEAAECIGQLAYEVGGRTSVFVEEAQALPEPAEAEAAANPTKAVDPYRHEFGIPSDARR